MSMTNSSTSGYKHKVLIVDDEPLNIEFLETLLSEEINVIFATSGEDALSIVSANKPDMILLDIMMPGMDGYEVCKRLKGNPDTKDIPVVFVTAKQGPDEEARGLELGAIDYITKPFNPEIVKSKVRNNIVRIATPRPDLEQYHNKDRRGKGRDRRDPNRDRRASGQSGALKWIAISLLAIVILGGLVVVGTGSGAFDEVIARITGLVKGEETAQSTSAPKPVRQAEQPRNQSSQSATVPAAGSSDKTRTPSTSVDRSSANNLQWVDDVDCVAVPEVKWWSFVSHRSIVRYVERNLKGDWETYAEKWNGRLASVEDIYDRGSTAITNTGVQLSGPALAEYIEQMKTRVDAIACLREEAERRTGK